MVLNNNIMKQFMGFHCSHFRIVGHRFTYFSYPPVIIVNVIHVPEYFDSLSGQSSKVSCQNLMVAIEMPLG